MQARQSDASCMQVDGQASAQRAAACRSQSLRLRGAPAPLTTPLKVDGKTPPTTQSAPLASGPPPYSVPGFTKGGCSVSSLGATTNLGGLCCSNAFSGQAVLLRLLLGSSVLPVNPGTLHYAAAASLPAWCRAPDCTVGKHAPGQPAAWDAASDQVIVQ